MKIILPKAIEKQLCVIARNLWMQPSHACLMVGAGFSRNAIKTNSSVPTPPVWNALADSMLEEMHGKEVAGETASAEYAQCRASVLLLCGARSAVDSGVY